MPMQKLNPHEGANTRAVFEALRRLEACGRAGDAFRVELDARGRVHVKPSLHGWRDEHEQKAA